MKKKLQQHSYMIFLVSILVVLIVVLSIASPFFLSWRNCRNILNQSAIYMVLSVGMTFVICMGEIDLSVGSVIGFSGMVMGMLCVAGVPSIIAALAGLAVSSIIGMINGILVAYGKISSFIVTLASMSVLRGFILVWTNAKPIYGFSDIFTFLGSGKIGPVNVPIILSLTIAVIGAVILHKTLLGNYCLFCGSSALALNRSGVNVKKVKIAVYALCGLCAGIAGMIVTARLNSAEPLAGQGYEMDAIAAAVLGGTSMQGGKGNVAGTVIACLILNILKNGMILLSVSSHYQEVLTGVILVIAVLISESNRRKRSEI
ncbi:MAG: ABC transporter permease [Eubacteriales bacterium]|nr:ABC transporter permease [Eubacteriales bacterium]